MTIECVVLMMVFATTSLIIGIVYVSYMYIKDTEEAEQQIKEAERRAEVAERAVREYVVQVGCRSCPYKGRCDISNPSAENDYQECYEEALRIAEKDIAEEKKMTKAEEKRDKIAQIIAEHLCPQGKAHKTLYGAERRCYSRDNFAECEKVSKCVDALIAAGIGDVSCLREHRVIAEYSLVPDDDNPCIIPNVPLRVTQLYSGEEVEKIAKERDELRSKVEYIHEQDEVIKEYKHRAEVAERAGKIAASKVFDYTYEEAVAQAEKELAEERKDD